MSAATSEAKILPFSSDKPLTIGRYTVIDKRRKRGNWGIAYNVYDPVTKTRFVAKRYDPSETALHQLAERGLELDDITRNEFTGLNAPEKVVQSFVELDNNKPFLIMPPFRGDLEELITNDDSSKNYLGNGLSISEITSWITDMTKSLSGFHKRYNEAHGDIKPDNYFYGLEDNDGNIIDNGLWLGDSGTKTGSSTLSQNESRARMGSIYTRAPENFRDGSRPEMRSDVSATGTTIFKLLTGKFMFEDELDNSKDPNKYMSSLDNKILDSMIKKKLEVVPRNFRKFLYR